MIYPTIIDNETFVKCQQVRLGLNKKSFKYSAKPFLFRGLLKCKGCGCVYTSYMKKERYTYLRPTHGREGCGCMPIREEIALSQVERVFSTIRIPEAFVAEVLEHLKKSHAEKNSQHEENVRSKRKEYDNVQAKLERVLDLLIDGSITQSDYDRKVQVLRLRQHEIEHHLASHTKADETFHHTLSSLVSLMARADECFARADIEQKRKLMSLIFANLEMEGATLCYSLRKPFDLLAELPASEKWRTQRESNS